MYSKEEAQSNLRLFRGAFDAGRFVSSPFVTKVEFRLRLAGVPYVTDAGNPWNGPKGKIPFLEVHESDEAAPQMLGDSALIIRHLMDNDLLDDLNASLSQAEKAQDLGLRALLEDKLYFYHMRECWVDNYYDQREQALSSVPYPIRVLVGFNVFRKVTRTLYGQGCGRYSSDEINLFRREIWFAFDDLLANAAESSDSEEPFWCLGGEHATEADITLFSFIASIITGAATPGSRNLLLSLPNLMDYATRIADRYFADYEHWKSPSKPGAVVDSRL